jgi:hypothetical protein
MPRLLGYRERLYGNFYDAIHVLKMDDRYNRLFNNQNIGSGHLTNMMIAGQFHGDQTFVLINVYVRTNLAKPRPQLEDATHKEVQELFAAGHDGDAIGTLMRECRWERTPLTRALEEWAHTATVTVIVGHKPVFSMNAHDLMDGPSLGPSHRRNEVVKVTSEGSETPEPLPWRKQIGRPIIVPVRQVVDVRVESPAAPTVALRRLATEAGVLPEPLVWVHLEGLETRDVA